jgi:hypothetical protein
MLNNFALTLDRGEIIPLGDEALAGIIGGDGALEWFVKKVGELLFDCIAGDLDNLIDAIGDGYQAGQ